MKIPVRTSSGSYDVILERNIFPNLKKYVASIYSGHQLFVITDYNVEKLYALKLKNALSGYKIEFIVIKPGEQSKSLAVYEDISNQLLLHGIKKDSLLLLFGGGVVGDLGGFVASTLLRGIRFIQMPTTLLAQVDSSIGGKVGINLSYGKNMLGTITQPKMVLIDPEFLKTLAREEYDNGLAEVIKCGFIQDKSIIDLLRFETLPEEELILKAIAVKKSLVEKDESDQGVRRLLNFGHTFGHAYEKKYELKHGYAVALGMIKALRLGIHLGISKQESLESLISILEKFHLPVNVDHYAIDREFIIHDKKSNEENIAFVFVETIGTAIIKKMDVKEVLEPGLCM